MLKMQIDSKDVDTAYDADKGVNSFTDMKDQIADSGLPITHRSHEFVAADIIPKDSNLHEKSRRVFISDMLEDTV